MMLNTRLRSVRQKLLLMVLVANFFTLMAAGGALLYHGLMENRNKTVSELETLAGIIGQGSMTALEFDDPKVANENLAQLRANPNIVAAGIFTAQGRIFAKYLNTQGNDIAIPAAPEAEGFQFKGTELAVFKRITNERGIVGTVYLKERYELSSWLRDYLMILGLVLLTSLGLGLFISSRLERWISGPIQAVSRVARQVMEERNYHLRAAKSTEDEIGQLAEAFNGMLQTLEHEIVERSTAEQTVRTLNAELEQRVADRTAQLQISNQTLATRTQEAEAANRAKADFLANMSHEIRTPMNGILGLAYLLDQMQIGADASDMVKKIRNAGRSLQSIINDILDFSKIEAGRLEIEHAPFNLIDVFDNLAGIMAANAGDKDIELVITPPPEIGGHVIGDALRLEQILINLTGNAIKFTDHGEITVGISLVARDEKIATLRFSVKDTGIGIAFEKQAQIFAAFSQADISTTRRFGGTGLGLTISRHLVEKMGGEIGVISEPGMGSEFWFTIPFEWSPSEGYSLPEMATLDVLVTDDNEIARETLSLTARAIGWHATKAKSGEEAIQKVYAKRQDKGSFDVLLVDWKMPGMDGLTTAKTIRESCQDDTSPIVLMVTAYSRDDLLKQADIDVVDGVLTKPVTISGLYNAVAEALRARGGNKRTGLQMATGGRSRRVPGVRVLVVDDSEINREVALRILTAEGATVSLANDGQAAVSWLQNNPDMIDIVLMDVQMPVMDGYEATRYLRGLPLGAGLPIVALTAGAFKSQQKAAQEAGMDAFVSKPFNVDELLTTIQHLTHCQPEMVEMDGDVPAHAALPHIDNLPGIAVDAGMKVWNDLAVYRKFLLKFTAEFSECGKKLMNFCASNDLEAAKLLVHKMKGAAGNLALFDVALRAAELEKELELDVDHSPGLQTLQAALNTAFASIAIFTDAKASHAPSEPVVTDLERTAPLLIELLHALDTDNPNRANQLFESLAFVLPADSFAAIRAAVDDFDFRTAETLVRRLANDLKLDLRE